MELRERRGQRWCRLDRSAFYPASGGQPSDVGELALQGEGVVARVVDAQLEDGAVWHRLEGGEGLREGARVTGRLAWERRYRHMQRHTAQHALSQALKRVDAQFDTLSVSLSGARCTIDFTGSVNDEKLALIEETANAAARRALPVLTFEVADADLKRYRLRRPPKVTGRVRLVAIGDYDLVACGGTHVRSSAEVLPIKLLGVERVKGGLNRLTFSAGSEALEDHGERHAVTSSLVARLSAPVAELPGRVEQLVRRAEEAELALREARSQLAAVIARELLAEAAGGPVVAFLSGERALLLDALVGELQATPGVVSLLAAPAPDGGNVRFTYLSGEGAGVDVRPLLQTTLAPLGGRGGGRADRAQGSAAVTARRAREALAEAAAQLEELP